MGAIADYLAKRSTPLSDYERKVMQSEYERRKKEEEERQKLIQEQNKLNDETATVRKEIGLDRADSLVKAQQDTWNGGSITYNKDTGLYESDTGLEYLFKGNEGVAGLLDNSSQTRSTDLLTGLANVFTLGTVGAGEKSKIEEGNRVSYDSVLRNLRLKEDEYVKRIGRDNYNALLNEVNQKASLKGTSSEGYASDINLGSLQVKRNSAWDKYMTTGSSSDKNIAEYYDRQLELYQLDNPDIGKQTFSGTANYLPQLGYYTQKNLPAMAVAGVVAGLTYGLTKDPKLTAAAAKSTYGAGAIATGFDATYEQTRGGEFGDMVRLGIPEDIARQSASNSAVWQSIIEEAETAKDIYTLFKMPQSKATTDALQEFLKAWGMNIISEGAEEGSQSIVGFLYEKDAMNRAGLDTSSYTAEEMLGQAWEEAKGGAEIGATMFIAEGLPHIVMAYGTNARNQRLSIQDAPINSAQYNMKFDTDDFGNKSVTQANVKEALVKSYDEQIKIYEDAKKFASQDEQRNYDYLIEQTKEGKANNTTNKAVEAITAKVNKELDAQAKNKPQKLSKATTEYANDILKKEQEDARNKGFKDMTFDVAKDITLGQKYIAAFAKKVLGVDIVYYDANNYTDGTRTYKHRGMWNDGGVVFVNSRARTTKNALSIAAHEWAHRNYYSNPALQQQVNSMYSNEEAIEYGKQHGWNRPGFMSLEEINRFKEEMYADDVGEYLSRQDVVAQIETNNTSAISVIQNALANFVENTIGERPQFDKVSQFNLAGGSVLGGMPLNTELREQVDEQIRTTQKNEKQNKNENASRLTDQQKSNTAWYREQKEDNKGRDEIQRSLATRMKKGVNSPEVKAELSRLEKQYNNTRRSAEIEQNRNLDSEGRKLPKDVSRRFRLSKVRDSVGRLLVVYHATTRKFEAFEESRQGENWGDWGLLGLGYYFDISYDKAVDTWGEAALLENPDGDIRVIEAYLNIVNPLYTDSKNGQEVLDRMAKRIEEMYWQRYGEELVIKPDEKQTGRDILNAFDNYLEYNEFINEQKKKEFIRSMGFDGVIDEANGQFVVYESNQAKYTSNKHPTDKPEFKRSASINNGPLQNGRNNGKLSSEGGENNGNRGIVVESNNDIETNRNKGDNIRKSSRANAKSQRSTGANASIRAEEQGTLDGRASASESKRIGREATASEKILNPEKAKTFAKSTANKLNLKDGYRVYVERWGKNKPVTIKLQKDTYFGKGVVEESGNTASKYETVARVVVNNKPGKEGIPTVNTTDFKTTSSLNKHIEKVIRDTFAEGIKSTPTQQKQERIVGELKTAKGEAKGRGRAVKFAWKKEEQQKKASNKWKAKSEKTAMALASYKERNKEKQRIRTLNNAKKDFLAKMKRFQKSEAFKYLTPEQKETYEKLFGDIYTKALSKKPTTKQLEEAKAFVAKAIADTPGVIVSNKVKNMLKAPQQFTLDMVETIDQLGVFVDALEDIMKQARNQKELVGLSRNQTSQEEQKKFADAVKALAEPKSAKNFKKEERQLNRADNTVGKILNTLENAKDATGDALKGFFETALSTIETELLRMARGNRKSQIMEIFNNLDKGVTRERSANVTLRKILNDYLTKKEYAQLRKDLNQKSDWVDTGVVVTDTNGRQHKLIIDHGRLISLAMHSMQEQSLKHISGAITDVMFDEDGDLNVIEREGGGLTIPSMRLAKQGKIREAIDNGYTVKLTQKDIENIVGKKVDDNGNITFTKLSKEENDFIKGLQEFFEQTKQYTAEAYKTVTGLDLKTVENYFPIVANKAFIFNPVNDEENLTATSIGQSFGIFDAPSFVKERDDNAFNPIVLENVADVVTRMLNGVSKYYGYNIALHNNNILLNSVVDGFSVENGLSLLDNRFLDNYKTLSNFISGKLRQPNDIMAKFRGRHAEFTLGLNPGSWVKQLLSVPTTMKYFTAKELLSFIGGGEKVLYDTMKNYLETIGDFEQGKVFQNFLSNLTPDLDYRSGLFGLPDVSDKIDSKSAFETINVLKGIARFDRLGVTTVARMLLYAELSRRGLLGTELSKLSPEQVDSVFQEVGRNIERVLRQTQPDYSQTYRTNISRNRGTFSRFITMYSTPTLQMTNNLLQSAYELQYAIETGNKDAIKHQANVMAKSAVGVFIASLGTVLISRAVALALKGGDDDDEEYDFGKELVVSMLAPTLVLDDVARGFMGMNTYESQTPELVAFDAITEIGSSVYEIATGKPENAYNKWKKIVTNVGMLTGIPVRDLYKIGKAVLMYSQSDLYYKIATMENANAYKKWLETEGSPDMKDFYKAYTVTREKSLEKLGYHKADKEKNIKSNKKEIYQKALESVFPNDSKKVKEYMTILGGYKT